METRQLEKRIDISNRWYPLYDGLSKDLLFYIAVDSLFLTIVKGFSAFDISLLGVFPTLICVLMQPLIIRVIKLIGNVWSSRLGTFILLVSSIVITFGTSFTVIAIGQFLYDISFVFKNVETIVLRNNLRYQEKSKDEYNRIRGKSNSIYAEVTFVVSLIVGVMFNINHYLPMYCCIFFCIVSFILSFTFYEVKYDVQEEKEVRFNEKASKKILLWGLVSYVVFLGIVVIGQQDGKLFIQYQLTDWYGIEATAIYLSWIVAASRVSRIVLNKIFNTIYSKLQEKIPVIMSTLLMMAFIAIILGAIIPGSIIVKVLLLTLGFCFVMPMRDAFIIYMDDLLLSNCRVAKQQTLAANVELLRKLGKIVMNFVIALILLKVDLFYIMILFALLSFFEIILSKRIVKLRKF